VNEKTETNGYTPLHLAVLNGHLEVAHALVYSLPLLSRHLSILFGIQVELGAKVDEKSKNGSTALYLAVRVGEREVAEFLLEKGFLSLLFSLSFSLYSINVNFVKRSECGRERRI
jgi:hypothetical protein